MAEFRRVKQEDYGPSTVRLEKLDMTEKFCRRTINGTEVILPVLNLRKYDKNAECYAFVETLQDYPITLVDILYSYQDILYRFEHEEQFRKAFLEVFSRRQINISAHISPALTVIPKRADVAKNFAQALKSALQDAFGTQIIGCSHIKSEEEEIEEPQPKNIKKDGMVKEFIKAFYEIITGIEIEKQPKDVVRKKKVVYTLKKEAILMKSGVAIVESEVVDKYFSTFQSEIAAEESHKAKDSLAIYIAGINEDLMMSSSEYLDRFGKALLESNMLEVCTYWNPKKLPKMDFVGKYSESKDRLIVYREIEDYFNQLNEKLVPRKKDDREER